MPPLLVRCPIPRAALYRTIVFHKFCRYCAFLIGIGAIPLYLMSCQRPVSWIAAPFRVPPPDKEQPHPPVKGGSMLEKGKIF